MLFRSASVLICYAFFAILPAVRGIKFPEEDGVLVLTSGNIESALRENPRILIEFYSPSCRHCQALAPEFAAAAKQLKARQVNAIPLAKIDVTNETALREKYSIRGMPTIAFFKEGVRMDYTSENRTADLIVAWLDKKLLPATVPLKSVAEARKFSATGDVALIGFFSDPTSDAAKAYKNAALARAEDLPCGLASSSDILADFKVTGDSVIMFKNFENSTISYCPFNVDDIGNFVKINRRPLLVPYEINLIGQFMSSELSHILVVFMDMTDKDEFNRITQEMRLAAEKFKEKVVFAYGDPTTDPSGIALRVVGITLNDTHPSVRLVTFDQERRKFKPDFTGEEITQKKLVQFVQAALEGKVKRHFMSQEIPADWDMGPVKVLVSKNFHQVVKDRTKNVLVNFYSPSCIACIHLEPVWEQLGEFYKNHPNTVIAKILSVQNEVEDVPIRKLPTIKFYPADSDQSIDYDGDRDLESFKKFIESGGKIQPKEVKEKKVEL